MHIILVGNYKPDRQESMLRYVEMVSAGLQARGVSVTQVQPEQWAGRLKSGTHGLGKWLGYVDKYIIFPFSLSRTIRRVRKLDVRVILHICDHSNAMYARRGRPVRQVVTCHDLLAVRSARGDFPQNTVGWTGRWLQRWVVQGLRRADHIVCDSEATRNDLLALGGFDPAKSETLYIGLNYPYAPQDEPPAAGKLVRWPEVQSLGRGRFIFHIGGNQWYKNRAGLLRIYFMYVKQGGRLPLVMAGKELPEDLQQLVEQQPAGAQVIAVGNVSNEELNALYCQAACLLFPSLYEGFGWPVLEAMAAGCPVVCSERASLPEVGGDAAVYFDPSKETDAAQQVSALLAESPGQRLNRLQKGNDQARTFNQESMIKGVVMSYKGRAKGEGRVSSGGGGAGVLSGDGR